MNDDTLDRAMRITDQKTAELFFDARVILRMSNAQGELSREQAESLEREYLGYYAGYFDSETRERVEALFKCEHPFFGKVAELGEPTAEEAFALGMRRGSGERFTLAQLRAERAKP